MHLSVCSSKTAQSQHHHTNNNIDFMSDSQQQQQQQEQPVTPAASSFGRGKGGKGLGGMRRHANKKLYRDSIRGIGKQAIRRLARRGGVKRISEMSYDETRGALHQFVTTMVRDASTYAAHGRRKTITAMDVLMALKRNGRPLYGIN